MERQDDNDVTPPEQQQQQPEDDLLLDDIEKGKLNIKMCFLLLIDFLR